MKNGVAWSVRATSGVAAVLAVVVAGAAPAPAHEGRATGGFTFVVGWGDEPAYTGSRNSVEVSVSEAGSGAPVVDLGNALKVEVSKGSDKTTLPLEANFGEGALGAPGDYRAWLTPTRPGTYTFRLTGSIGGQAVDESFTSSSTTFDDVEDAATIQFPAKDPSAGQISTRIDREVSRLQTRADTVEAAVREADDRVDSAHTLATVGVVAGVLGLAAAGALVTAGRRGVGRGSGPRVTSSRARAGQAESLSR